MSIGERISDLRNERKLSQYQLAKLLDVSRQAVSKWENDQTAPDTIKLIQLADVLDVSVEYLATGKQVPSPSTPTVITVEKTVDRIVEKPVVVEKTIEVEKVVEVERVVEKPVIRKVIRKITVRNPAEFAIVGLICFLAGLLIGILM